MKANSQSFFIKKVMKTNYTLNPVFVVALLVAATMSCKKEDKEITVAGGPLAQSDNLVIPAEVDLPPNLPAGNSRVATFYAIGVQKYKAQVKPGSNPETYEWVFVAPQAELFNANHEKVGTHGAGPYWSVSGSNTLAADSIFAQPFDPARTATVDANSIPWLLLKTKEGKTPTGIFKDVDYIQRIATSGGKAPSVAPQAATDTADVFYVAIYRFSKKN
jgi:hypothetical protein